MSPDSTDTDRIEAIRVLQDGRESVARERPGETPPAGGVADDRPTAPGLGEAVRRLEHHARMIGLCLDEMQRGPGGTPWGFAERLSLEDLYTLLDTASVLTFNAAVIVTDTSNLTPTPATEAERVELSATRKPRTEHLVSIATAAAILYEIATRLQIEIPPPTDDNQVH